MSKPFRELADEFNTTAKAYLQNEVSIDLLTTKYSVLIAHKATAVEEKKQLVEALYGCGLKWLQNLAAPGGSSVDHQTTVTMLSLFSRVTEDDSIHLIPKSAPEQLTDAALDLIGRAESSGGSSSAKGYIVKLAAQTLAAADKIKAVHDQLLADVSTSQDITPSKKIELKQKDEFKL